MLDVISGRMAFFEVFMQYPMITTKPMDYFHQFKESKKEKVLQTTFKMSPYGSL